MDALDRARVNKAKQQWREMVAELCYFYPQYKIGEFAEGGELEDMPIGDIELLLNTAKKLYYQSKLDDLNVAAAAQSKKGYAKVNSALQGIIKKLRARI